MFDWSNLERSVIVHQLFELSSKLCGHNIAIIDFHNILSRYIKKHFPVSITCEWDPKVKSHKVLVGGTYDSYKDEANKKCIEFNFYYNPEFDSFVVTQRRFKGICSMIADTMLHEIIHMRQYRRRGFKSLPNYASTAAASNLREEQEYLGCTDEIDAYGFNISCELLVNYRGNPKLVVKHLNLDLRYNRQHGGCWKMYLKAFGHNHKHEIIKRVKKKVIRYLPRAIEGKPFKSRDWICH